MNIPIKKLRKKRTNAFNIEVLDKNDPDYKLVEKRSKDADLVDYKKHFTKTLEKA